MELIVADRKQKIAVFWHFFCFCFTAAAAAAAMGNQDRLLCPVPGQKYGDVVETNGLRNGNM